MKLLLIALLAFSFSAIAADMMPEFYGKVAKEIRYVDQESKYKQHTLNGAQDIENSFTRLGAKNTYKLRGLKAGYDIELGVATTDSSALKIRKAKVDLMGAWGTLTLGRDYTAISGLWSSFDPLAHTGNAIIGTDQAGDVKNVRENIGFLYRSRKDLISYATPVFSGLQLKTSIDQNQKTTRDSDATAKKYWDTLLSYNGKFGKIKPTVAFGYSKVNGKYSVGSTEYTKDTALYFLGKVEFGASMVALHYGKAEKEHGTTTKTKPEDTYMTVALGHKLGMGELALTYAKHDVDTKAAKTSADKSKDSQIALGYTHNFSKNLCMHVVVSSIEHKQEDKTLQTAKGNKATMVNLGTIVKF